MTGRVHGALGAGWVGGRPWVWLLLGCAVLLGRPDGRDSPARAAQAAQGAWRLVWHDEFDGPAGSPPDPASWTAQIGDGSLEGLPGWGNRERQYYTDRPENLALDGQGHLAIVAREVQDPSLVCYYGPCRYTSARITTRGKVEVRFGRVEARIRLPGGQGIWPAFWMLGTLYERIGWPGCGEIDVVELVGREPGTVYGTVHGPGYSGERGIGGRYSLPHGARFEDDFHVFAIEWVPGRIRWYVDGVPYHSVAREDLPPGAPWVFDGSFFMILNVAVGGSWPGYPDSTTAFPRTMLVDYVRVYAAQDLERM